MNSSKWINLSRTEKKKKSGKLKFCKLEWGVCEDPIWRDPGRENEEEEELERMEEIGAFGVRQIV